MQSATGELSVRSFATRHLDVDDRDDFISAIGSAGVTMAPGAKDVTLLVERIRRIKIQTSRNVTVFAPLELYEKGDMTVTSSEDGEFSDIRIRDKVKSITGASGAAREKSPT